MQNLIRNLYNDFWEENFRAGFDQARALFCQFVLNSKRLNKRGSWRDATIAATNSVVHGNSGGALLDKSGDLIGILSSIEIPFLMELKLRGKFEAEKFFRNVISLFGFAQPEVSPSQITYSVGVDEITTFLKKSRIL